jgi:hypothetical protein
MMKTTYLRLTTKTTVQKIRDNSPSTMGSVGAPPAAWRHSRKV